MNLTNINISFNKVEYEPSRNSTLDSIINIDKDIFKNFHNVVIGDKKCYNLYQNANLIGYCHSLNFTLDVIKSYISNKIDTTKKYKLIQKQADINTIKLYLYEVSPGYLYNGHTLIDKYMIQTIPKVELIQKTNKNL